MCKTNIFYFCRTIQNNITQINGADYNELEDGRLKSEVGRPKTEVGRPKTEDRRPKSEAKNQTPIGYGIVAH